MAPAKYELRPLNNKNIQGKKGMAAKVHLTSPVDSEKDANLILDYGRMGLSGPRSRPSTENLSTWEIRLQHRCYR